MCIPYLIHDPPTSKRPRRSGLIVERRPHNSPRLQPAIIEISPRLTYVASPRPDCSPLPPRARLSSLKPLQCQEAEALKAPMICKEAPDVEEGKSDKSDPKPEAPKPKPTPAPPVTAPKPEAPCKETPPPQKPQPQPQPQPAPPPKPSSPPTPNPPFHKPHLPNHSPSHLTPSYHNYHHPHPHNTNSPDHTHHRSRSPSPSSTISRRSFERLRRNLHTVLERVRALEAEKEAWETEKRRIRERREWDGGRRRDGGRRDGSFVRERREGGRWGNERGRERWRGEGGRWERELERLGRR